MGEHRCMGCLVNSCPGSRLGQPGNPIITVSTPAVWLFYELRCNAGAFCGDGQGTGGAGAVGALNRYHSPNDHPAHGAVSGCVIWLARPILLGMMLQDFLLPSDVPLLESWLLPISIVLAQDSWPLTLSMFSSFSFGMCVYMCMWMCSSCRRGNSLLRSRTPQSQVASRL